jgi:DNA-binding NtrC family response regulator
MILREMPQEDEMVFAQATMSSKSSQEAIVAQVTNSKTSWSGYTMRHGSRLSSILQDAGHETLSASTVAEAQAIIHSDEKFDLVFSDVGLANHPEGGITVGQLIGQARPGTPILYTSGRALTDGMKSLFVQRSAFLSKPYTGHQLVDAVNELLR